MITIHNSQAKIPFLRYKVAEIRTRPEMTPRQKQFFAADGTEYYKTIGYIEDLNKTTKYTHVLGFGETADEALKMAEALSH